MESFPLNKVESIKKVNLRKSWISNINKVNYEQYHRRTTCFRIYEKNLGISEAPVEAYLNYGYALLTIAGADGEVSEAEINWLLNHQRRVGAPEEVIEKYKTFDYKNADLESFLSKITVDVPT